MDREVVVEGEEGEAGEEVTQDDPREPEGSSAAGASGQAGSAWERIADTIPDQPALICGNQTRTWREYDERAARFASVLEGAGLGVGAKVGIYLHNSNEYLEAQYGIFKIRGCPINVNYRY